MRYSELNEEEKAKYGPSLFKLLEQRKRNGLSPLNIDDCLLVFNNDDKTEWGWIYLPDID